MKYQIERPEGMPDWVQIGVKGKFWYDIQYPIVGTVVGYYKGATPFFVRDGAGTYGWYIGGEPLPEWEPEIGKYYAFWNDGSPYFMIAELEELRLGEEFPYRRNMVGYSQHIADIEGINCSCNVETLKKRVKNWR